MHLINGHKRALCSHCYFANQWNRTRDCYTFSVTPVFDDVLKLKVLKMSQSILSETSDSSSHPAKNNAADSLLSAVPKTMQSLSITEEIQPSGREREKKRSHSTAQENRSVSPAKENSLFPGRQSRAGSPTAGLLSSGKVSKRSQMGERRQNMNIIGLTSAAAAGNTKDLTSSPACVLL